MGELSVGVLSRRGCLLVFFWIGRIFLVACVVGEAYWVAHLGNLVSSLYRLDIDWDLGGSSLSESLRALWSLIGSHCTIPSCCLAVAHFKAVVTFFSAECLRPSRDDISIHRR